MLQADHTFFQSKLCPEFKPFNLHDIRKRLGRRHYRCPEELIADFKVAYHILKASPKGKLVQEEIIAVSNYIKNVINELKLADDCPWCIRNFYRYKKWFIMPCPWGHALVLAQVKGEFILVILSDLFTGIDLPNSFLFFIKLILCGRRRYSVTIRGGKPLIYFSLVVLIKGLFDDYARSASLSANQPQILFYRGIVDIKNIFYARDPQDYFEDYSVKLRGKVPKAELRDFDTAIEELKAHIRKLRVQFPNKISLTETFKTPWQPSKGIHIIDPTTIDDSSDEDSGIMELDDEELKRRALLGANCEVRLECVRAKLDIGDKKTVSNISQRLADIAWKDRSIDR